MPKTAVGLFNSADVADEIVRNIEALGIPRREVRAVAEPLDMAVTGVMSMPHLDFEVDLGRELLRMGATRSEADAWVDGVRHGGVLVLATGEPERVDAAAEIMKRHDADEVDEVVGSEPQIPVEPDKGLAPSGGAGSLQAGRVRYGSENVGMFVW